METVWIECSCNWLEFKFILSTNNQGALKLELKRLKGWKNSGLLMARWEVLDALTPTFRKWETVTSTSWKTKATLLSRKIQIITMGTVTLFQLLYLRKNVTYHFASLTTHILEIHFFVHLPAHPFSLTKKSFRSKVGRVVFQDSGTWQFWFYKTSFPMLITNTIVSTVQSSRVRFCLRHYMFRVTNILCTKKKKKNCV